MAQKFRTWRRVPSFYKVNHYPFICWILLRIHLIFVLMELNVWKILQRKLVILFLALFLLFFSRFVFASLLRLRIAYVLKINSLGVIFYSKKMLFPVVIFVTFVLNSCILMGKMVKILNFKLSPVWWRFQRLIWYVYMNSLRLEIESNVFGWDVVLFSFAFDFDISILKLIVFAMGPYIVLHSLFGLMNFCLFFMV